MLPNLRRLSLVLLLGLAGCRSTAPRPPAPPELDVPRAAAAPVLDGRLDDACWPGAALIPGLRPFLGDDAQARIDRLPTEIRLTWSPEALYVAFSCRDDEVYASPRAAGLKASLHQGDVAELFLDPLGAGRFWIELQVNPLGETFDQVFCQVTAPEYWASGRLSDESLRRGLLHFSQEFALRDLRHAVTRSATGWTVELAIPAAELGRYRGWTELRPMSLRANLVRYDWEADPGTGKRRLLGMLWSPTAGGCPHISPARMGTLHLVD